MNSSDILSAALSRPKLVLGEDFEAGFKKLMRLWHPDLSRDPKAQEVSAKLNLLLQSARRLEKTGGYHQELSLGGSRNEKYYYSAEVHTSTGSLFVCDRHLIWKTKRSDDDLCRRWLETVKSFTFPAEKFREEFDKILPKNSHTIAKGEYAYTIVSKPKEVIRVADIMARHGKMDPKHVAWILSTMYNVSCWMSVTGISHYGFTVENYFIHPETHVGSLYGGWFFSAPKGQRPIAAPASVRQIFPDLKTAKRDEVHLRLIKIAGRQMLGHDSMSTLRRDDTIPRALRDWLVGSSGSNPIDEYRKWHEVIPVAFGGRRFTKYDLTAADVYGDT